MSRTIATADDKAYNGMTGRTTLRGIWVTESRFDMKPQALDIGDSPLKYEIRTNVDEVVIDEEGVMYGFIRFEVAARQKRQRVIHVSAKYVASYVVQGGCTQQQGDLFMERVGRLAAYPYFRALSASLVAQAGANLPPLPMMSFAPRNIDFAGDAREP